jgi:hypothetical protein
MLDSNPQAPIAFYLDAMSADDYTAVALIMTPERRHGLIGTKNIWWRDGSLLVRSKITGFWDGLL